MNIYFYGNSVSIFWTLHRSLLGCRPKETKHYLLAVVTFEFCFTSFLCELTIFFTGVRSDLQIRIIHVMVTQPADSLNSVL